jgi:hypothetical protein
MTILAIAIGVLIALVVLTFVWGKRQPEPPVRPRRDREIL